MADSDETIDPNDLDSIDALLDEAELDVVEKEEIASENADTDAEKDAIDSLLGEVNSSTETLPLSEPEQEEPLLPEQEEASPEEPIQKNAPELEKKQPDVKKAVSDTEQPALKKAPPLKTDMTVEEMDSIKKLIIIFGSVLTVLALTGIGIGVWSALAAKNSALDEETLTLIESIQVSAERVGVQVEDSSQSIHTFEKKLDALNFQLEGLATDLLEAQHTASPAPKMGVIDPLGLNGASTHTEKTTQSHSEKANIKPVSQGSVLDPESIKLAASVNKKMISAQRRIDEVNRRVKDIQSKHKALLLSIKSLEKQMVLQQKKATSKERATKELKQKQTHNPYQYSAPDDTYYDQSVGDSYP